MTIDRRRHVAAVLRLLNDADPYGLASSTEMGVPDDELLTEATQISAIAVMRECSSCDLDDVWRRWFDEPLTAVIGVMATEKLARRINGLRRGDLIAGASSDRAGSWIAYSARPDLHGELGDLAPAVAAPRATAMPGREPNARLPEQVRRAAATVEAATRLHVTCSYERRLEERVEVHGWHVTFGAEHLWFDLLDHDLSGEIRGRYREWPCRTRAQLDEALVSLNRLLRPL